MPNCRKTPIAPRDVPASDFERELVALIPFLRTLSRRLCSGRAIAEDMAQDALARAWRAQASFEAGSNMKAWLFTILRNCINSQARRDWRQAAWDETAALRIAAPPLEQEWAMQLSDVSRAVSRLPTRQREALILVGAGGLTHREASQITGAGECTMKSRIARGRAALLDLLEGGERLPPRAAVRAKDAGSDILAQLSAITSLSRAGLGARA